MPSVNDDAIDDMMTEEHIDKHVPPGMVVLLAFGAMLAIFMYGGLLYMCYQHWRSNGTAGPPPADAGANELAVPILRVVRNVPADYRHAAGQGERGVAENLDGPIDEVEFSELKS